MDILLIFIALFFLALGIASTFVAVVFAVPVILFIVAGQAFGLNWWQSLIVAGIGYGVVSVQIEQYYNRHFKRHAEEMGLSTEVLGQEIEVEGKLVKIIGSSGRKIVVQNRKDFFARHLDPRFVHNKLGLPPEQI